MVVTHLSISRTLESTLLPTSPSSVSKRLADLHYAVAVSVPFLDDSCAVSNVPFSFLMRPLPWLAVSFGTSDFAFMAGLLLSSLLFFVSALFCYCCTSFINEWVHLDIDGWLLCFLCHISLFLLYFQKSYLVVLV